MTFANQESLKKEESARLAIQFGEKVEIHGHPFVRGIAGFAQILLDPTGLEKISNAAYNPDDAEAITILGEEFYRRVVDVAVQRYGTDILPEGNE